MPDRDFQPATPEFLSPDPHSKTLLLVSGSPRVSQHTQALLEIAGSSLQKIHHLKISFFSFAGKEILACRDCFHRCEQEGHCWLEDDFASLAELWRYADGILLGSPVYTFGPPAPVHAFFERLQTLQKSNPSYYKARSWPQPVGIIAQGGSEYGGAEICAQELLTRCLSVGCVPVSGDMPGFSQGVIGQIRDGDPLPERLKVGASRLAMRVVELVQILSTGRDPQPTRLNFLIVKAGEFGESNFAAQCRDVLASTSETPIASLDWETFDFDKQPIAPCTGCTQFCSSALECCYQDGMQEFQSCWFSSDAIIWLVGAGVGGSLSPLRAAIDRMNQVRFETHLSSRKLHMSRYLKPAAHIVFGTEPNHVGSALQFLRHISLLYQHLLLPCSEHGTGELAINLENEDGASLSERSQRAIVSLVQQTAGLAVVIKSGLSRLAKTLPPEYSPSNPSHAENSPVPGNQAQPSFP